MEKQQKKPDEAPKPRASQIKVRSSVTAGASLESCMQDLSYWRNAYNQMCSSK